MLLSFLGIAGSLRHKSTNQGLLRVASTCLPTGVEMDLTGLTNIPFYNADIMNKPAPAVRVPEQTGHADALVLACPEYNYSLAPALKNILDWTSREPNNTSLAGKPVTILGADGGMGTSRARYHLCQVCVYLDLHPPNRPEAFANAFAGGFTTDGDLTNECIAGLITGQTQALANWTLKHKA